MFKTKTFLSNTDWVELRLYFKPCSMAQFITIHQEAIAEFKKFNIQLTDNQLGLYSNRAGLHFYCIVTNSNTLLQTLKEHGWKTASK